MTTPTRWATAVILTILSALISFFYADIHIAAWMHMHQGAFSDYLFGNLTRLGQSEWYLVPGLLLFLIFRTRTLRISLTGLFVFLSVAISGIAANIMKYLLPRARPGAYLNDGIYGFGNFALLHEWNDSWTSFPSGHSATVFSAAAIFALLYPRFRLLFFAAAALIAFSRIAVSKHFLSDVIAGSFLGIVSTILLYNLFFRQKFENPSPVQI